AALRGRALAHRQALGQQNLVGGRSQIGAEVAAGRVLEDRSRELLELRGHVRGGQLVVAGRRLAAPQLALDRDRAVDDLLDGAALLRLRAERRDAHREAQGRRAAALQQEAQGEQVVVQPLDDEVALQAGLEAVQRASEDAGEAAPVAAGARERGRGAGERTRERGELGAFDATDAEPAGARLARTGRDPPPAVGDRKSTRLNSSHVKNSYAVFCLKKKNRTGTARRCPRATC